MLPEDLSESERLVRAAFRRGAWVDLRTGDPDADRPEAGGGWPAARVVRAEVLSALLLGAEESEPGYSAAIRLRGARIVGRVDVMGAAVAYPFVCEYCHFAQELRFVEATTRTVRLVACHLAEFNGTRMRAEGIVNFQRTVVEGMVRLDRAKVVGEVSLRGARIGRDVTGVAVAAEGLIVEGPLECNDGFTARGSVQLRGARIGGLLDLSDAELNCPGSRALRAGNLVVEGALDCTRLRAEGKINLTNSRVAGWLNLRGACLRKPGDYALAAGGIAIGGGLWFGDSFTAEGEVRLIGARVDGNLDLTGARLSNPGGIALNLDRSVLADLDGTGLEVSAGTLSLVNAQISGQVGLAGARLDSGGDRLALAGDGVTIGGTLQLSRVRARGGVSLRSCRIGGRMFLMAAELANPGGIALRMSRGDIVADMFCGDLTATGSVKLSGVRIGSHLLLDRVRLAAPGGVALNAESLQAATVTLRPREPIEGVVNFRRARLGRLRDDPSCWPDQLILDGFGYDGLEPQLPARERLRWLARDSESHRSQPFEQLASAYAAIGQSGDARRVLYAKERRERAAKSVLGRVWGVVQDVTVAYGYQPWRAVLWLVLLLVSGSILFALHPPPPLVAGQTPHFNPVVYTLDLLVPIVDLGQKNAFNPGGAQQWFSYVLIAAGWILATTVARAAARTLGRG